MLTNLISISKLTRDLNCLSTFSNNYVTLQDRTTKRTIGIGREFQGLFHLISPSSSTAYTSMDTPLLIHSRFGHLNISKFQIMVHRFSNLSSIELRVMSVRETYSCPIPQAPISMDKCTKSLNCLTEFVKPSTRTLFQTIQRFPKTTHLPHLLLSNKPRREVASCKTLPDRLVERHS